MSNSVSTSAFVVRDETPIKANVSGTLVPLVEDGKRVANGDDVAVVFDSENAARNYNELKKSKRGYCVLLIASKQSRRSDKRC